MRSRNRRTAALGETTVALPLSDPNVDFETYFAETTQKLKEMRSSTRFSLPWIQSRTA